MAHTQLELSDVPKPMDLLSKMFHESRHTRARPDSPLCFVASRVLLAVSVRALYGERCIESTSATTCASAPPPTEGTAVPPEEAGSMALPEVARAPDPDAGPDAEAKPEPPPFYSSKSIRGRHTCQTVGARRRGNTKLSLRTPDPLAFVRVRERCEAHGHAAPDSPDRSRPNRQCDSCLECLFRNAYIALDEPLPQQSSVHRHSRLFNLGDLLSLQTIQRVQYMHQLVACFTSCFHLRYCFLFKCPKWKVLVLTIVLRECTT